ncbi:MAG TPA: YdcF family protein [Xanthomonadaceae bacterium]|nr:YdcF family protein [Xanthomonadaceae bacterium]
MLHALWSRLDALVVSVTWPPALSAAVMLLALLALALRRRRIALALAVAGIGWTGLWSLPFASDWLRDSLEARNPIVAAESLPRADAIVVLGGGGGFGWVERPDVDAYELPQSRVAAGARAWLAGRAPLVILSGGRGGRRTEAETMARAIARLGVPRSALLLEQRSRDTRDNALYTARLARERGVRKILLVTSQLHMPRASLWFRDAGITVVPLPVPEEVERVGVRRWLPSRGALHRSGRALKEYAGLLGALLHQRVRPLEPVLRRDSAEGKTFTPPSQAGS